MFDLPNKRRQIEELESATLNPNFWNDRNKAQSVTQKIAELKKSCDIYEATNREFTDTVELLELAEAEDDDAMFGQLLNQLAPINVAIDNLELTTFLSEPYDISDTYLSIKPGAGGTESSDWASMLYRMYLRYIEQAGFKCEVLDLQEEEQGIKAATLRVKGQYAYGYLKGEKGVHRLVRISPFDANARRHTSFTAVDVLPILPDDVNVEIRDDDLKLDFFRSSGAGGQHVNKTSSAVRITHVPTGIVVACQIERSQHQNREVALGMLKAKLFELQRQEKQKEIKNIQGDMKNISWGNQIRSYVFCPYTLVKDLRTGQHTSDVRKVMDGDLEPFIKAYLNWHANGERPLNISSEDE
ncbi:MAG: peptide chain release factor 2 [Erysipelotrichia bacterium]|nr:peptide chain release factor 2 [Erysipelotrichia bacterium]